MGEAERTTRAKAGDWVVIHGQSLGDPDREGLILEVLGEHEHYRVRWDEEHESIFYPDSSRRVQVRSARPRKPGR